MLVKIVERRLPFFDRRKSWHQNGGWAQFRGSATVPPTDECYSTLSRSTKDKPAICLFVNVSKYRMEQRSINNSMKRCHLLPPLLPVAISHLKCYPPCQVRISTLDDTARPYSRGG